MPQVSSQGSPRASNKTLSYFLQGLPLFLLLGWVTKAFLPDLRPKAALMARDLELRLEIVSSSAALWKQLLLPVFTAVCLVWMIRSRKHFNSYLSVLLPVMLFGAFLLMSFVWSDHPSDTMRRAVRQVFLFTSVAGVVIIGRQNERFVNYLQFFSLCLLIFESLFLLVPSISFDVYGNFTGLHPAKNEFGGVAGAFALISICIYRHYTETPSEKRVALWCSLGWCFLLIVSGSKTPIGFVVIMAPLILMSKHMLRYLSISVIVIWLIILVVFPMLLVGIGESPFDFYRSILPEEALTGRTGIWFHLISDIRKDWMFGTGYGAYWGVGDVPEALDIKWSYYQLLHTAHSGFVDLVLELGVIPTVIWLIVLWIFLNITKNSADPLSATVIAFGMLHNCMETSFAHGIHFVWVLMLIGIMNILYSHARKPNFQTRFGESGAIPVVPPVNTTHTNPGANTGAFQGSGVTRNR